MKTSGFEYDYNYDWEKAKMGMNALELQRSNTK